jgi:integrase
MSRTTTTRRADPGDRLAVAHAHLVSAVEALTQGEAWQHMLTVAARLPTYSATNILLIGIQCPDATHVAGIRAWNSLGRRVRKGEKGIAILAPCLYRAREGDERPAADSPLPVPRESSERPDAVPARRLRGFRVVHVFDASQTVGEPLPDVGPQLLAGDAPRLLTARLVDVIRSDGFTFERGPCTGTANGHTDFATRTVRVRDDVPDAQASKTLAHDLLTAPVPPFVPSSRAVAQRTRRRRSRSLICGSRPAGLAVSDARGVAMQMNEDDGSVPSRDVAGLIVPTVGGVAARNGLPGAVVLDATGEPVAEISDFLCALLAGGACVGSVRSYAMALLRWWRFLAAIDVRWDRATRVEVRDFVLWMRFTPKAATGRGPARNAAGPGSGYAPATINHNLAVLRTFYADRLMTGLGPLLVNPVPDGGGRAGGSGSAHHNPMQPQARGRRGPLQQKMPARLPRSLPDHLFDALFAVMGCDRDRALLAFYVSTGARASELLGATLEQVDVGAQQIGVHRKGSGRLQWLPASSDAFVWLRLYQQHQPRPAGQRALWLTRRAPHRPLTYAATRRVLQRANAALGTGWTLHDLRHTAAQRMIDDPRLSLTDVQWVLGHAHLTTTQIYLRPREDEVIARVLDHQRTRREPGRGAAPSPPVGGYRPDVLRTLLGGAGDAQ